jgi:hypothetical protein
VNEVVFLLGAVVIGLIPAAIARRKGHGFWTWWLFGAMLWIVALPVSLFIKDARPRCPYCAEIIRPEATVCPHCQRDLVSPEAASSA